MAKLELDAGAAALPQRRNNVGVSQPWFGVPRGDCQSLAGFCLFFVYCLTQLEPKESAAEAGAYFSVERVTFDVSGHFCNT